jgi:hypothetical protein
VAYFVTPPLSRKAPRFDSRGAAEDHAREKARDGYISKVYRTSHAGMNDLLYMCKPVGGQAITCKIVTGGFSGSRRRRSRRKKRR